MAKLIMHSCLHCHETTVSDNLLYCDYSTIPWQGVSFLKELAEFQGMQAES
jgi:hypothetical protein